MKNATRDAWFDVSAVGANSREAARFQRAVPPQVRASLRAMNRRDNWRNWLYIGGDWVTVVAAVAVVVVSHFHWASYLAAVVVIGSRQRALMNLQHEAAHRKLFASRTMNDLAGRFLVAFPLMDGLSGYATSHWRHHAFLWGEQDPERDRFAELGLDRPVGDRRHLLVNHVVRPLLLSHVPYNVRATLRWRGVDGRETAARAAFWVVAVVVLGLTGGIGWFVALWVVPFLTSYQVIRYWAEMGEHASLRTDDPWQGTRNWTGGRLTAWLLAPHSDDNYHLAHHLYPGIPHFRLAKAHRLLMDVPQYAGGHHCDGFFFRRSPSRPSVLEDILDPDHGRGTSSMPMATSVPA